MKLGETNVKQTNKRGKYAKDEALDQNATEIGKFVVR
jgi:hypothetical protein